MGRLANNLTAARLDSKCMDEFVKGYTSINGAREWITINNRMDPPCSVSQLFELCWKCGYIRKHDAQACLKKFLEDPEKYKNYRYTELYELVPHFEKGGNKDEI